MCNSPGKLQNKTRKKIIAQGQLRNANFVENIYSIYAWNALSKYFILL